MSVKLYRHALSGHSHRVQLFLSLLGIETELVDVNLAAGEHKKEAFLQLNPAGQVPVIDDNGYTLADSNAILVYLARSYASGQNWLPEDIKTQAEIQRWLSVAAGPVASGPAAARLVTVFCAPLDAEKAIATAYRVLDLIEKRLEGRDWLVTNSPTIGDIANYTYIAHAPEGNVSLENYPNIRGWLKRIEQLPGFVPMVATAVGLAA